MQKELKKKRKGSRVPHVRRSRPPYSIAPPKLTRVVPGRRFPCSLGVTSRTFFGEIVPEDVTPSAGMPGPNPSMPRAFSAALLSVISQRSRLAKPAPALRPTGSRRLDSSSIAARFCSRRGPGPQSCIQPGVAQPPSLIETSFSHVTMQAMWPPCPQPWHQVQRDDPLGRGAVNESKYSLFNCCISDGGMGSVWVDEPDDRSCDAASVSPSESSMHARDSDCSATHSGGGSMLMQIAQGS